MKNCSDSEINLKISRGTDKRKLWRKFHWIVHRKLPKSRYVGFMEEKEEEDTFSRSIITLFQAVIEFELIWISPRNKRD